MSTLESIAALIGTLPADYISVCKHAGGRYSIALQHDTIEDANRIAGELGATLEMTGNSKYEWMAGYVEIGPISVSVYGPHVESTAVAL